MGGRGALRAELERAPAPPPPDLLTSVARALEVLELVAREPEPLPVKAIAGRLGISLGTAYHVMHTLEHGGYVVRLGQGRFGLGSKMGLLTRTFTGHLDPVPAIRPHVGDLVEDAGEDAYVAVMRGGEVVVADVVESRDTGLHCGDLGIGFSQLAHTTAVGKVLLADIDSSEVDHYLRDRRLTRLTPYTLVERRHVKRQLRAVRDLGVARDLEEFAEGCCCVGFPVRDASGTTVAAVGISVPSARWRTESERLTAACALAADQGTRALAGYAPAGR